MRHRRKTFALGAICAALLTPSEAIANPSPGAQGVGGANHIQTLDMMLMATSLRCRKGAHDFRAEYQDFSRYNMHHIKRANDQMRRNLTATYGQRGGERELDRMSVRMANRFGNGHPSLGCEELKQAASELARAHSEDSLLIVASRLLGAPRIAYDFP